MENSHRIKASGDTEVATYLEIAREKRGEKPVSEITSPGKGEGIVILDFGSQYSMLIARRIRECQVYCEVVAYNTPWEKISNLKPKGFILSGGPASVYDRDAPLPPLYTYESGLPILGICYGMQAIAHQLGGRVTPTNKREYGLAMLHLSQSDSPLFAGVPDTSLVWMSHADRLSELPPGFKALAYTDNSPIAAMGNDKNIFGIQFHPEVSHTIYGPTILKNFARNICGCPGEWVMGNFVKESVSRLKEEIGEGRVICAISGGIDSTVAATLVHQAIGDQLTAVFVNNGLLRKEEPERTLNTLRNKLGMNVVYIDASDRFLNALQGVSDPEQKRKIIGEEFIHIFEEEANRIGKVDFLVQGTLYPDVIESTGVQTSVSARIKSHHNVGGLPAKMNLKLIEPLRYLFKDEVREVGRELGLPEDIIWRQPFPGPGLAIRILGEVTREKLEILRACDWIVMDEIKKAGLYKELWQSFAILTNSRSIGITGDYRTYGYVAAIRAVTSTDAMTADWSKLPYAVLTDISNRIVNEVPEVNRVVYDITSKPPATIEWE